MPTTYCVVEQTGNIIKRDGVWWIEHKPPIGEFADLSKAQQLHRDLTISETFPLVADGFRKYAIITGT